MNPTSLFSRCIAIGLAISVFATASLAAAPAGQNPPQTAAAEKAKRQIEKLRENELLRVKLNDNSDLLGCFKGSEAGGFLFSEVGGSEKKILFEDVAKLTRYKRAS